MATPTGLNCRGRDFQRLVSPRGLASPVGGGFLSREKNLNNKPQPLNVTSSTNKPNLKVVFVFGGAAEKERQTQNSLFMPDL